jgi:hypothetical protein
MLRSLRSFALSLFVASLLASGIRTVTAAAPAAGSSGQASLASVPVSYVIEGDAVESVRLSLPAGAPQEVRVRLSANGSWYSCQTVGKAARCSTPGATVRALGGVEIETA